MALILQIFVLCWVCVHTVLAQYGYNTNGYGYGGYPTYNYGGYGTNPYYGYQQQQTGYGYYPSYGYNPYYGYQQQTGGYPYYGQQQGYNPNSYYGNGLNQAYASSSNGGTATAQATSGAAGYYG